MKVLDERIIHMKNEVYAKGFIVTLYALWGLITYHGLVLRQPVTEFLDLFVLTTLVSSGVLAGLVKLGVFHKEDIVKGNRRKKVFGEIAFFSCYMVAYYWLTGMRKPVDLVIAFVIMVLFRYIPTALKILSFQQAERQLEE